MDFPISSNERDSNLFVCFTVKPLLKQFGKNIKFSYTCFDQRVMLGYIRRLFYEGWLILLLKAMGFKRFTNGVLRIFTDQQNAHIKKEAERLRTPII